tara:strand:+ start:199 stop:963 length:765 start_codon:yes stop_codon:yes gene_type:complete
MSKADFTDFVSGLTDEEIQNMTGVGAALRDFGKHLEDEYDKRFGIRMDTNGRKLNGGKPVTTANPIIDIEVPGVASFLLRPSTSNNKARGFGYAKDVGLSDKVKTGNVPPTLLTEILVDKMATMLGGNIKDKALSDLRSALRACMTVDDGKFTFDKKKAPPLNHPVEVAEFMLSLKEEFIGTASGASHVSMEVIPIPVDVHSHSNVLEQQQDIQPGLPSSDETALETTTVEKSPSDAAEGTFIQQQQAILFGGV